MRPDDHKSKESRIYQARKKNQGDSTAAEVAERRRQAAAKARDKGTSIAAIRRRNGEIPDAPPPRQSDASSAFSRRQMTSNADRYKEATEQELMEEDAALGIDRETTNLVAMLEKPDESSGAAYFKFKDEQAWESPETQAKESSLFQVDFDSFEGILEQDTLSLLGLPKEDEALVAAAFEETPRSFVKPLVPAFAKNARGLMMLKPSVVTGAKAAKDEEEQDGIYLRNDGSNHRPPPAPRAAEQDDNLDELLAMESNKTKRDAPSDLPRSIKPTSAAAPATKPSPLTKPAIPPGQAASPLPRPGQIQKPKARDVSTTAKKSTAKDEDEAFLDELLG